MRKLIFAGLMTVLALPAEAVVVDVVIRGNIRTLTDVSSGGLNVFGDSLAAGAAYTVRFTYDTSVGTRRTLIGGVPVDNLSGSSNGGYGNPVSATLTIGQTRHNILGASKLTNVTEGGYASLVPSAPDPVFPPDDGAGPTNPRPNLLSYGVYYNGYNDTFAKSDYGEMRFNFEGVVGTFPDSLETPFTVGFRANPNNMNTIPAGFGSWITGYQDRDTLKNGFVIADFGVSRLTVRPRAAVAPVPLPASALMLITAIGCLMLIARRRLARAVPA